MFGPNSAIGFGSLTKILEAEADYIVKVIRKLQKEDYATIEPKKERVADFGEYVKAYFAGTVYTEECKSWYKRGGDIVGLWPGSTLRRCKSEWFSLLSVHFLLSRESRESFCSRDTKKFPKMENIS